MAERLRLEPTSIGPRFESYERNIFVYSLRLSFWGFFYLLFCLGLRCLFVYLLVFAYDHSKQTRSLLLLDLYH